MQKTWKNIYSQCLFSADTSEGIIGSINHLLDDENSNKIRNLIFLNNEEVFNSDYWNSWSKFLNNLR